MKFTVKLCATPNRLESRDGSASVPYPVGALQPAAPVCAFEGSVASVEGAGLTVYIVLCMWARGR